MYDSLDDKNIKCKFCEFEGEFDYKWTSDAFTVVCPSCGKINYKVKREKIDELAEELIMDSMMDLANARKKNP